MAVEVSGSGRVEDDIVDAEIVGEGRMDRLREKTGPYKKKAGLAVGQQWKNITARLGEWFSASDITDDQLTVQIEERRVRSARRGEIELKQRAAVITAQMNAVSAVNPVRATALAGQLADVQAQIEIRQNSESLVKVGGRELDKARWGKKASRTAVAALGGVAYANIAMAQPTLGLAALGLAAPFGWWFLGRPKVGGDERAAGLGPSVIDPQTGVAVPAPEVPPLFVPQTLADMSRVSLVKRESARVQGEHDLVTALVKARIITEAERDETHLAGVIEPSGPGWSATVELPRGAKASSAVARIEELASALRIKNSRIELRVDTSEEGHDGRFHLWVANEENPYGQGKSRSPLVDAETWDFWTNGIPLGTDPRQGRHDLELIWSSILIGGLPGFGKSFLARLVASAAALDPHITVHVATGKAGPDWAATKQIAKSYVAGNTPDRIHAFLDLLNGLIADMQKIGQELEQLSEDEPERCPEGKLTRALAEERGLGLTLLIVDELQELLDAAAMMKIKTDDDPDSKSSGRNGKDVLVETMARFVRVSRYAGGMGLFITQRPDSDSVPTKLREVCAKRACFRVKGVNSSKMVLGDDAVNAGAAPHTLLDSHKGVFVLDAGGVEGHLALKADVIELPEFKEINLRGRELRLKAGTLKGFAAEYGVEDQATRDRRQLLADVLVVLDAEKVDRARTERLVELLVAAMRLRYEGLTNAQLQARLREAGAGTTKKLGPIDGMANPNGYLREDVAAAHAKTGK
ncbi:hypothetical protein [Streptomyces sp. NPDC006638]|uniref:hypothetical protein n=1 Tax=Streptomyces sp. NPDC006638 TaxID=3157183 RepID=UPI0033BF21AB